MDAVCDALPGNVLPGDALPRRNPTGRRALFRGIRRSVMRPVPAILVCACLAVSGPALAQSASGLAPTGPGAPPAGTVGSTATGDLPLKTGATTAVGQTKPPGDAAPGTNSALEEKSRELDRKIDKGICTGCK